MENNKSTLVEPVPSSIEVEKRDEFASDVESNFWVECSAKSASLMYKTREDTIEEKFGYMPMIRDLKETYGTDITVLDYGCGPGKVSRRLVQEGIRHVEGVDKSQEMIQEAINHSSSETINPIKYQKIKSGELPFADNYFDAAICCFVLVSVRCRDEFVRIIRDIYRALKPGGTFYILDINSKCNGIHFPTFCHGEPGVVYKEGDAWPGYLKVSEQEVLKIVDTYWSRNTYEESLRSVGFSKLQVFELNGDHLPEKERRQLLGVTKTPHSPYLLFKATKAN